MKTFNLDRKIKKVLHYAFNESVEVVYEDESLLSHQDLKNLTVFLTTVVRGSQNRERTGYLYKINWKENQVINKNPIPLDTQHPFWNTRGGNRGGRGIIYYDNILYVAASMSIIKYDLELNYLGEITHPYFAGIHEIYLDELGIWVTSTVHDLVIKIDFDGKILDEWWGSKSKELQRLFDFKERELNINLDFSSEQFVEEYTKYCDDEIFHINTVCAQGNNVYVLSNKQNSFIRIRPEPAQLIFQDNDLMSPHNGILTPDGRIILNDTQNQFIRLYDLKTGKRVKTISTAIFNRSIRGSAQFSRPGWQRGLVHVKDSIFLVATSPATIFEVDIDRNVVGKIFQVEADIVHSSHGLEITWDNVIS